MQRSIRCRRTTLMSTVFCLATTNVLAQSIQNPTQQSAQGSSSSLAGEPVLTKDQWREDLNFLAHELPKRHANAFHFLSRERFEAEVDELNSKIDRLSGDEIFVGMDRIESSIGDGHTYIRIPADAARFPLEFESFDGDYRLAAATAENKRALGARLVKIDDVPVARARELLLSLTPADETQPLRDFRATSLLNVGMILHGSGIIRDRDTGRYTFADDSGNEFSIDVHAVAPAEKAQLNWIYVPNPRPLYLQRPEESFWCTYLSDSRTVYCSFRSYKNLDVKSKILFGLVKQQQPDKLIIDMRLNDGGDFDIGLKYLVHPIRKLSAVNRKGHLFILIGPRTFSAAMANAAHFRNQTNAILVGQPIGEKPNSYQEARDMVLPNSHWIARCSITFYTFVKGDENLVRPDKEIVPTWEDYKAGSDPVLDWVLKDGTRKPASIP